MSNENVSTLGSLRNGFEGAKKEYLEDIAKDVNKINECLLVSACQFAIGVGLKTGLDILRRNKENE